MKKFLKIGPFLIFVAAILWSFDGLLRTSLYSIPPAVLVFWEHILGLFLLSPLLIKNYKDLFKLTKKEWIAISIVALFSGALGTILYTAALGKVNYIQFSVVPLLQQLQPIWGITTAAILLKEKLDKKFILWAALAIVASYFVTFKNLNVNFSLENQTLIAGLLALSAGVVWAVSTSFSKIVLNKISFQTATLLRFALAPFFALMFIFMLGNQSSLFIINQGQWIRLGIIALSTGGLALFIYYAGLKKTPAKVSAVVELAWPASAILIDYFHFHNGLSITQILGVIVMMIAIFNVSKFHK